jgi:N-acetylglutamate synthase
MDAETRALEECALRAWPAAEILEVDGWRLRHTSGVTRRANSAWIDGGDLDLEARIDTVERFYAERGQPAMFQVGPLAPAQLDGALERRGYAIDAPVSVQVADAGQMAVAGAHEVVLAAQPPAEWMEISARRGRFAAVEPIYRALLQRLQPRAVYAFARAGGVPAAVGMAVMDDGWAGIFSMLTLPSQRRQGLGRAVLAALAGAADRCRLYLQVEQENAAALALYRACGFRERYRYHYRVRQT